MNLLYFVGQKKAIILSTEPQLQKGVRVIKWDFGGTLDKVLNVFEGLTQALFSKLVRVFVPPAVRRHAACV